MSLPSLDPIKDGTEKAEQFVEWLAGVLRGKNWVTKILLLDVFLFLVFNPLFLPKIVEPVLGTVPLPPWYPRIFWPVIGLIFMGAVIVAWRTGPRRAARAPIDLTERRALKALRPFGFQDAAILVHLQREQNLRECLDAITDPAFRFGILYGDSGCGKTSFLQAWPLASAAQANNT